VVGTLEDDEHRFWVCAGGNVYRFQKDKFTSYPFSNGISNVGYINSIKQLSDHSIILQAASGAYTFTNDHWEKTELVKGHDGAIVRQIIETNSAIYYNLGYVLICQPKNGSSPREIWKEGLPGKVYF